MITPVLSDVNRGLLCLFGFSIERESCHECDGEDFVSVGKFLLVGKLHRGSPLLQGMPLF